MFIPQDDNALRLAGERYFKQGEKEWGELADRVSNYVVKDDHILRREVRELLNNREFLANSPCLMNAGTNLAQLSACFVVPIRYDSMNGIFQAITDMAEIQKCGGGTGFDFSVLREKGSEVSTTKGRASGVVSFMRVFNSSSRAVEQGGIRRGANMGKIDTNHPDFIDTIEYKAKMNKKIELIKKLLGTKTVQNLIVEMIGENIADELQSLLEERKELTYFNISAGASDMFMAQVVNWVDNHIDTDWQFISRKTGNVHSTIKISKLWEKICLNAWASGDPGMLFMDIINAFNPIPCRPIKATNPCGEQPLGDDESCNLASANLLSIVDIVNTPDGWYGVINWQRLEYIIRRAVRFLDRVIDVNYYPLPQIEKATKATRKIGLGVMGVADMLYVMGMRYGSPESLKICEEVQKFINEVAYSESVMLAEKYGCFPDWELSVYYGNTLMRNATRTTIAPTGSIAILAGCSSGIEPNFLLAYDRTVKETHGDGEYKIRVVNPVLVQVLKMKNLYSDELMDKIVKNGGTLTGLEEIPEFIRNVFVTSFDVSIDEHLEMQLAFQRFVDNAVSKTINMPSISTPEDISRVYIKAWKMGLKGITIYRDKSLDSQVLNVAEDYDGEEEIKETHHVVEDEVLDISDEELAQMEKEAGTQFDVCPNCGKKSYTHQGGCGFCVNCNWSACHIS